MPHVPSPRWQHLRSKIHASHTHESQSAAHVLFREDPAHAAHGQRPSTAGDGAQDENDEDAMPPGVNRQTSTGVLYCTERAMANGFDPNAPAEFAQLGQGAPETGQLPGGLPRITNIDVTALGGDSLYEYAPVNGVTALRKAVAEYYNSEYRQGMKSQYTWENISIVPGGRVGLTRVASIIGKVYVGFQIPEYSAYAQILHAFQDLVPIPSALLEEDGYSLNIAKLRENVAEQGISVFMASNPKNPTGQVVKGEQLKELCSLGRPEEGGITVVLDEFYSHFVYEEGEGASVSAARYVEDVEKDSVILIGGLTKDHRYPSFRVGWVVGPKPMIRALGQMGGALDGGANHILQCAALQIFNEPGRIATDRIALQRHFKMKRDYVLKELADMGLPVAHPPTSTFYVHLCAHGPADSPQIWLDLSSLPEPLSGGLAFFEACLREKVIVVPGIFFDIDPVHRRNLLTSKCHHFVRLSFGPELAELERGMTGIRRVLASMEAHVEAGNDIYSFVSDLKR